MEESALLTFRGCGKKGAGWPTSAPPRQVVKEAAPKTGNQIRPFNVGFHLRMVERCVKTRASTKKSNRSEGWRAFHPER